MKYLSEQEFHNSPLYVSMHTNHKNNNMPNMHYHNGYEFFFVTSGKCEFFFEEKIFSLCKGKVLIIPPSFLHRSVYTSNATETYRIELHIIPSRISDISLQITSQYTEPTIFDISINKRDYIYELVRKMQKELTIDDSYSKTLQAHYVDELLIYIDRYSRTPENNNKKSTTAQLVMDYINNNFKNKISISDISKHLHINKHTLFTEFKKSSNLTISEYINYIRISNAERLLISSNLSITDIAFECGFNDSNYFSSVFKKSKGISPTQFVKIHKRKY